MAFESSRKGLTKGTREILEQGESATVDYKAKAAAVGTEDLVAFANSEIGGQIFVGVEEAKRPDGSQFGRVLGHDLSDGSALQIINKAITCVPPIAVRLHAENTSERAIIRVEIRSSVGKPHSTPGGVYCRRDGSRNRPLHPSELLDMFLNSEGQRFASRFETVAQRTIEIVSNLEKTLSERIREIGDELGWAEFRVDRTESTVDSIESTLDETFASVEITREEVRDLAVRLRAIMEQNDLRDPVRAKAEQVFLKTAKEELGAQPKLVEALRRGEKVNLQSRGIVARELSDIDIQRLLALALNSISKV